MISVQEAKKIIKKHTCLLNIVNKPLSEANQFILAENVYSLIDSPPFHQSAMDGYAFKFDLLNRQKKFYVSAEITAGSKEQLLLQKGTVAKIFTGAPIPEGADTVIIQEFTERINNTVIFKKESITKGSNIRLKASQIAKGEIAAHAGTKLTAGAIGYLAGLGLTDVKVFKVPKTAIIITGSELVPSGRTLNFGQIYESNSLMLKAALHDLNINMDFIIHADDNKKSILQAISNATENCDLVLLSGGISVGKYDLVREALLKSNVEQLFYKVKQKPGKPLYFGKKDQTLIFGLPGNPSAVLTCFYEYVVPCIRMMCKREPVFTKTHSYALSEAVTKNKGLTYFMKGKLNETSVLPLKAQESFKLSAFTEADCLIVLEEGKQLYEKGEMVEVKCLKCEV